jgi:hypothetical protein
MERACAITALAPKEFPFLPLRVGRENVVLCLRDRWHANPQLAPVPRGVNVSVAWS